MSQGPARPQRTGGAARSAPWSFLMPAAHDDSTWGGFPGRPAPWADFSGPLFRQDRPIQRKCAECAAEEDQVQTKLAVSKPGDPLEQEADRFAEGVMEGGAAAQPDASATEETAGDEADDVLPEEREIGMLWPKRAGGGAASVPAGSIPRSGGQPLAADVRGFMRERTGFDFANVRVHADSQAAASASRIAARAYTLGHHIYFDQGEYQPASHEGRKLLAHELAHVVQQGEAEPTLIQRQGQQGGRATRPRVTRIVVRQVAGGAGGQAIAYDGDTVVRTMRITSGRPGHPTAAGDFALGEADANHRSSIYGSCTGAHGASRPCTSGSVRAGEHFQGTPMPNFRRFNGAIGFHEGSLQTPSHGCIHLSAADSAWVFALPANTAVHVEPAPVARPNRRREGGQRRRR